MLTTGKLPHKNELKERYQGAALLHNKTAAAFFTGKQVKDIEKLLHAHDAGSEIKGMPAFKGLVIGTVRIITDPHRYKTFNDGDILVTGATRPEFLPIMHKAAGFVTDAGGILSHAAITAREMRKPCVIGCKIATKIFKDGDKVEVNANKGIIKKLS